MKYKVPSSEILQLADVTLPPALRINSTATKIVYLERSMYKSIEDLSQPEIQLAGLKLNPLTNTESRAHYYDSISIQSIDSKKINPVIGLPDSPKIQHIKWSPNEDKIAFAVLQPSGLELWVADVNTYRAERISSGYLNASLCTPYIWSPSGNFLLTFQVPEDKKELINRKSRIPEGPVIKSNEGKKSHNRTYQDLLKDTIDEHNFEILSTSIIVKVDLDGNNSVWKNHGIYSGLSFSPDGNYIKVDEIHRPFSYVVPYYKFPKTIEIYNSSGDHITLLESVPALENLPKGFMAVQVGKRNFSWKSNSPATLCFAQATDNGDPKFQTEFRDEIFLWDAPFSSPPKSIGKTKFRFSHAQWGNPNFALITEFWWDTKRTRTIFVNLGDKKPGDHRVVIDRNFQDRYQDPGRIITEKNEYNRSVICGSPEKVYRAGEGHSPDGKKPFIDRVNLFSDATKRIWQVKDEDELIQLAAVINIHKGKIILQKESKNKYPNYFIKNISDNGAINLTNFKNPFISLTKVSKRIIKYRRKDGVALHGTLYLPPDHQKNTGKKLPLIMWAYPNEFNDKDNAGQITTSDKEFIFPWYGSPIFWVMKGYAVFDEVSFPIIGENGTEPNDSFIQQLSENALAAIDALDNLGFIDREKVAIGGHSYGAFMAANLLTHTDLFAAGIARSGAYNRTLTPFGFQSEQRNYWEAPETYNAMSPFMHADKLSAPLLLIHGKDDNNSGTFTMQSERYFEALKGLGANVRLVLLPKESHGYQARESVLHILWEQDQWLEKHLKNNKGGKVKPSLL